MTSTRTDDSLIARLRGLPASRRAAALAQACLDHPSLSARLPAIVAAISTQPNPTGRAEPHTRDTASRPNNLALIQALECALESDETETAGTRIADYKLLQEIGEGGCGVVWMAEQLKPIRRRVALKIIKLGLDPKEVIARFEAERPALALLDHPNIARVFEAGTTGSGRPYFVMELVRGIAITRYCDENRLSPEDRLRLFITVCLAMQHAHEKGTIHRNLKWSNILVTMHDGVPVPKIVDFGIAKATGVPLTDMKRVPPFHAFSGTLAYSSPEQLETSGLTIDSRSDIYSLGVLLYELLTGQLTYDPATFAKSEPEATGRALRESAPPLPSARVAALSPADRTLVSLQRGTTAEKLTRLLRGDLDWVVMRALEKDRSRRYETPAALAADIQRHLANEPVTARPPDNSYFLRKFIRRHRIGFYAATTAALVLAGLIVLALLFGRKQEPRQPAAAAAAAVPP